MAPIRSIVAVAVVAAHTLATLAAQVPGLQPAMPLPGLPRVPRLDAGTCFVLAPRADATLDLHRAAGELHTTPASEWRAADAPGKDAPQSNSLVGGDFDGDGELEWLQRVGEHYQVLGPDSAPRDARTLGIWFSGRAVDLDGDGKADLPSGDGTRILNLVDALGRPRTELLLDLAPHLLPGTAIEAGTAGDYDRDGDVDFIVALPERGLVWLPRTGAQEDLQFGPPVPLWPATPGTRVSGLLLEDIDGDGWLDLFVTTCARGGDGSFAFTHDEPRRDRTPEQDAELARLERMPAPGQKSDHALPASPGTLRGSIEDPFARLLEWKGREERIHKLRSITTTWHARPVVVHRRRV